MTRKPTRRQLVLASGATDKLEDMLAQLPPRRVRAPRTYPETQVQESIVRELRKHGVLVFAVPNGGMLSDGARLRGARMGVTAGIPDLCVISEGRALFIEVKAPGKDASPRQEEIMGLLRSHGACCAVCTSWAEAKAYLLSASGVNL